MFFTDDDYLAICFHSHLRYCVFGTSVQQISGCIDQCPFAKFSKLKQAKFLENMSFLSYMKLLYTYNKITIKKTNYKDMQNQATTQKQNLSHI